MGPMSRIAAAFDALMTEGLGYGRYAAHGGDWGSLLSGRLGAEHAANVLGIHLAMPFAAPPSDAAEADRRAAAELEHSVRNERGYSAIQRTKPDALTVAQTDSPAGLAAWIVEKFRTWSDGDGDVTSVFSPDILLTNLMMYWAPRSVASAARIYFEAMREPGWPYGHPPVLVPTGVAAFPAERFAVPRTWVERKFNVQRYTEMPAGGHFGALEQPQLLVDELRAFFRPLRLTS
jgi:pimeloyl-ACP methyl ester carboxylesterase